MRFSCLAFAALATVSSAQIVLKPAAGDGLLMTPKTLDLKVKVRDGVSEESWDYVFATRSEMQGEAEFAVAIPDGGVVTGFAYY